MRQTRNVNQVKQPAAKHSLGLRILLRSVTAGAVGVAPLLLYILLGPANGNPIGLGLLAMLGMVIAMVGGLIGAVTLGVEHLRRARR